VSGLPVAVVIATLNNPRYVAEAVESILSGSLVPDEVIVVDQSRPLDPRVGELPVRHPQVRLLNPDFRGLSRAQNLAILSSSSDLLVFTDDDVLVDHMWLEAMVAALERSGPRAVVTGRVLAADPDGAGGRAVALATDAEPAVYEGRVSRDVLSGNSMGFHRSVFEACGLFDERLGTGTTFGSASDNDFGYRVLRAGYRIEYVPAAVLYHRARRSGRDLRKLQWDYGRGQGAFLMKHSLAGDRFTLHRLFSSIGWWLRRIAKRPLLRRSIYGHGDLVYLGGFLSAAVQWGWTQLRTTRARP
jgi:GT2 family glycosyltransferase